MHSGNRVRIRRSRRRRQRPIIAAVIIASAAALIALGATAWFIRSAATAADRANLPAVSENTEKETPPDEAVAVSRSSHPNYRYSVVAGGVHSTDDVVRAVNDDSVVADHYRNISLETVHTDTLKEARRAYVSYRIGDRVFWTKHKVSLPAGEAILTDGVADIRARCGNRISDEPQEPTAANEPEAIEFEALSPADDGGPSKSPLAIASTHVEPVVGLTPPDVSGPASLVSLFPNGSTGFAGVGQPFGTPFLIGGPAVGSPVPDADSTDSDDQRVIVVIPIPGGSGGNGPSPDDGSSSGGGASPGDGSTPGGGNPPIPGGPPADPTKPGGTPPDDVILTPPGNPPVSILPPTTSIGDGPGTNPLDSPIDVQPVPEPGTLLLVGTGAAGAAWRRLRSRRKN